MGFFHTQILQAILEKIIGKLWKNYSFDKEISSFVKWVKTNAIPAQFFFFPPKHSLLEKSAAISGQNREVVYDADYEVMMHHLLNNKNSL